MCLRRKKVSDSLKKTIIYFLSFIIPVVVFILIAYESKIYPFGDFNFLNNDSLYQYVPMLKGLKRKLLNGEGLDYTWNLGLGTNYAPMYAYYLSSPLNWIFMLLPFKYITDYYYFYVCFKVALCGVTFAYYLIHKYEKLSVFTICISVCYALSSYMVWYCANIMWMDCLILFPLIILAIERLYKNRKCNMYYIVLSISIISNYYISMMICMFLVIYFFVLMISEDIQDEGISVIKSNLLRIKDFILYSLLAGATSAAVILPAILGLSATQSGDMSFPKTLKIYSSFKDLAIRTLVCTSKDIMDKNPNIFCSVIVLIIIPIYLLDKRFKLKKKIGFLLIITTMLLSFEVNVLDYIWGGLHFSNGLFARNSFIYIFFVLSISYEVLINIQKINDKVYSASALISAIYIVLLWKITGNEYKEKIFILSIFFIVAYIGIFIMLRGKKNVAYIAKVMLLIVMSYELYMNAGEAIGSTTSREIIYVDDKNTNDALKVINEKSDEKLIRIEKTNRVGYDDGEMQGYNSGSIFSSTSNYNMIKMYDMFGMKIFNNVYIYDGYTPIINNILSMDYFITAKDNSISEEINNLKMVSENEKYKVFENKDSAPLIFPYEYDVDKNISCNEKNPFINLNSLYKNITLDDENIYDSLGGVEGNSPSKLWVYKVLEDGNVFFKSEMDPYNIRVRVIRNDAIIMDEEYYYDLYTFITYVDFLKKGDIVEIEVTDEDDKYNDNIIYAYTYNSDKLEKFNQALYDDSFKISEVKSGYIRGKIDTDKKTELFTSIPYDKGWMVYVDGKKVKIDKNFNALIKFEVDAGSHEVEMKYTSPGRGAGIIISSIGIVGFIITVYLRRNKMKN